MRVSFQAMIAVAVITFLFSGNQASAMQLFEKLSKTQTRAQTPAQSPDDVMKGVSEWSVDNRHTSMVCAVSHFGLSFIYGRFNDCSGTVEMNFEDPGASKFLFEVNPSSVDTNDVARDGQLLGPGGLDTAQYDSITFKSSIVEVENNRGASKTGRRFQVTGNLTLHGETRRIKIPIDLLAMGKGPNGKLRCGFMSRFVVSRSEFGIVEMADTVGDSVAVTFCFQTELQKSEAVEAPKANPFRFGGGDEDASESKTNSEREKLENLFNPKTNDDVAPGAADTDDDSSDGEIN